MSEIKRVPDLRAQVFERIRERVLDGYYSANDKLTEVAVARDFGVSRTPAREALVMLVQAGILEADSSGFRLPSFSRSDMEDVFEIRMLIEPYAIRLISEKTSDKDLKRTCELIDAELEAYGSTNQYIAAHCRMRNAMFKLTPNKRLKQMIHMFEDQVRFTRIKVLRDPTIRQLSVEGNRRLLDALSKRDSLRAEAEMRSLLVAAQQALIATLPEA